MAKVSPFHSVRVYDRNVYHDNDRCTEGNNIETQWRRAGTGNRPQCDHCRRVVPQFDSAAAALRLTAERALVVDTTHRLRILSCQGMHPFIEGLVRTLPTPGTAWPENERKQWLDAARQIFPLIYKDSGRASGEQGTNGIPGATVVERRSEEHELVAVGDGTVVLKS